MADAVGQSGAGVVVCASCGAPYRFEPGTKFDPFSHTWPVRCGDCGREVLAPPAAAELAVDARLAKIARPKRRYPGRCFGEAFRFAVEAPHDPAVRLCHCVQETGEPYAWVEIGDVAFDPEWQRFYGPEDYRRALGIASVRSYSQREAANRFMGALTSGPWPEPTG